MAEDGERRDGRDLSGADLGGSNFAGQDLGGADLSDANLIGAELSGATLTGTNLSDAVLEPGDADDAETTSLASTVRTVGSAAITTVGLAALALGQPWFWIVFVAGFFGMLPAATKLAARHESRSSTGDAPSERDDERSALATLRDRYANGEIDEVEFERRVERLLETESVDDAEAAYGDVTADAEREREIE